MSGIHAQIVLFDGFDLLDALNPYEALFLAGKLSSDALTVELVTAEGPREVPSGPSGLRIPASGTLDPTSDLIVLPGSAGTLMGDHLFQVHNILRAAIATELGPLMKQALAREQTAVATVCGGSLMLAFGGLIDGRRVVTHPADMELLGTTGAIPMQARVLDVDDIVSGSGVTSGLDVAIYLIEKHLGPQIANAVESVFAYERRGTVWHDAGIVPTFA